MKTETTEKLGKLLPEEKKRFINAFWDTHVILDEAKRRIKLKEERNG